MADATQAETEALIDDVAVSIFGAIHLMSEDFKRRARDAAKDAIASPKLKAILDENATLRAALPPKPLSVAPDDEALIDAFEKAVTRNEELNAEDRQPLPSRLKALAADYDARREALRRRIAELRARVAEERAERVLRGKMLVRLRNKLIHTTDTMVDEGDRVYFASTNDADELRERVKELDAFKWDLILSEGGEPDPLAQLRELHEQLESEKIVSAFVRQGMDAANARAEAAEAELARKDAALTEAIDVLEGMNDDEINENLLPSLRASLAKKEPADG